MSVVNLHEAKTNLSGLLDRVARGEEIIVLRGGVPIARLVPYATVPRKPGRLMGKLRIAGDFDAPLPDEIARAFRRESD